MVSFWFTFPSLEVNGVGDNVFQLHEFQFVCFWCSWVQNWPLGSPSLTPLLSISVFSCVPGRFCSRQQHLLRPVNRRKKTTKPIKPKSWCLCSNWGQKPEPKWHTVSRLMTIWLSIGGAQKKRVRERGKGQKCSWRSLGHDGCCRTWHAVVACMSTPHVKNSCTLAHTYSLSLSLSWSTHSTNKLSKSGFWNAAPVAWKRTRPASSPQKWKRERE